MPKFSHPHHGSMQYWPRKRSKHSLARIRFWGKESKARLLGFIGYKAGMTQVLALDNRPKSMTKGEQITVPVSIIECPPLQAAGIAYYKHGKKVGQVLAEKLSLELAKKLPLPKKRKPAVSDYDDMRLLIHSQPKLISVDAKKPKILEIALGGSLEEKKKYAHDMLGKEIKITDVFESGVSVDIHGVTKGKGFQGTVKRYGVPIRQHKAEKTKRGIATLGSWTPKRVEYTVPQSGKMGYHLRTEYNKHILKISDKGEEVNPAGGLIRYGLVKSSYLLLKGSVSGPKKGAMVLIPSIRPDVRIGKDAFQIAMVRR